MNGTMLLVAVVLIWIAVLVGTYQRVFAMPRWFADPPASFDLIRRQSRTARMFWMPLSVLFMVSICTALVLNWQFPGTRTHIVGSIVCFGLTGVLSAVFFAKEVIAFTKIPANAAKSPELLARVRFWLRWTTVRNVLLLFSALFATIAYIHL